MLLQWVKRNKEALEVSNRKFLLYKQQEVSVKELSFFDSGAENM